MPMACHFQRHVQIDWISTWCWILPEGEAFHLCQLIEHLAMSI